MTSMSLDSGSIGNERVLYIPQNSRIGATPSDCLISYAGHSFGVESYPSAKMQSVYAMTLAAGLAFK